MIVYKILATEGDPAPVRLFSIKEHAVGACHRAWKGPGHWARVEASYEQDPLYCWIVFEITKEGKVFLKDD